MPSTNQRGFTVVELIVVVAVVFIAAGIAVFNVMPAVRNARVDRAHQTVMQEMKQARQAALDERRVHIVTFEDPRTVRVERVELGGAITELHTVDLPADISFRAELGLPTGAPPDGFGDGSLAVDFNGGNQIFFQPDGSALDAAGLACNGVVYIARPEELHSSRAVTVFAMTGRIRGWRLGGDDESLYWQ
jgi:prepilin-type N-terminal cleavage/methylation domain-containing protein